MGGAGRTVEAATRVYRWASRMLPPDFREAYGEELEATFRDIAAEVRRRRGRVAVASALTRSLADLVLHAPKEHLAAARAGVLGPGSGWSGTWLDVRQAARRLARRPGFAASSVLTLALGIAAATSVFSLVYGVVLSPLPYPDSDRVVRVDHGAEKLGYPWGLGVTYGFYRFYAARVHQAESMAMYQRMELTLTGEGDPVRLDGVRATPSLATVLRVRAEQGRWLTAEEGEVGAAPVVVLSNRVWRDELGGDPGVVGRTVELNGEAREVVGVMPADFAFPEAKTDFWVPRVVPATGVGGWNEQAVARLAPGATPASLAEEMSSLYPTLRETTDDPGRVNEYLDNAGIFPRVVTLKADTVGDVRSTLWILLGAVGFVLLVAVANVANLFLVRAEDGQRDTALRAALGAGRARIFRGYVAETLMISAAAGGLGIAGAAGAVRLLKLHAPVNVPRLTEVGLDGTVLAVAIGAVLAAALLLGLAPAIRGPRELGSSLKEGGRGSTGGRRRLRGRNVLVAAQVALALVLLIGSGLLFRTFQELRAVDPGFATRRALTFELGLPSNRYPDQERERAFAERLLPTLRALPGVESVAAIAGCLPLSGNLCWGETLEAEGYPNAAGEVPPVTGARVASTDYFETLGIPVRGRTFLQADARDSASVAILSERAAEAYFAGDDPIGRRIRFGEDSPWLTIVGVAGNVKARVASDDFQGLIYLPLTPASAGGPPPTTMDYILKTTVPASSLAGAARRAVHEIDPALPLGQVRTLQSVIGDATAPTAFALALVGLAAVMALLLGAVGVYSVVAYAVSRRTAEIGIRIALGARRGDVQRMVVRQGGAVVLSGVAVGLLAALLLTRLMAGLLFGVAPTDPVAYLALTGVMIAVAGVALWFPARRASRVQPAEALRAE